MAQFANLSLISQGSSAVQSREQVNFKSLQHQTMVTGFDPLSISSSFLQSGVNLSGLYELFIY